MKENKFEFDKREMKLPPFIIEKFAEKGITHESVRLFFKSDMGFELEYCDAWVVLTDSELAVLEVLGGIFPRKTYNIFDMRKTNTDIVERAFRVYSLDDYEDFHAEEFLSGGRAVAKEKSSGLDTLLFNFSNSAKDGAFTICRAVTDKEIEQKDLMKKPRFDIPKDERRGPGAPFGPGGPAPMKEKGFFKGIKSGETKRLIS
ncbi:MAG: hypothetical protein IIV81_02515, partial [Clostridia bacterium]|nr:hypothetical protein [Clostridia bacterium]